MIREIDAALVEKMSPIEQRLLGDPKILEKTLPYNMQLQVSLDEKIEVSDGWERMSYASMVGDDPVGSITFLLTARPRIVSNVIMISYAAMRIEQERGNIEKILEYTFQAGLEFRRDVVRAIDDVLICRGYNKIKWCSCVRGDRSEDHSHFYRWFVERIGGRVVGRFRGDISLRNGEIADVEWYEVDATDWIAYRHGSSDAV